MLLEAMRGVDARLVVVGFGPYRATLEAMAPPRTLFTGPLEHRHLVHLLPLADVTVVPSIFPEAFGMVAAEAAAAGSPPLVARHSGLAEVAAGLEEEYPERFATSRRSRPATPPTCAQAARAARALAAPTATRCGTRRARRSSSAGRGRASPSACSPRFDRTATLPAVGDEQKISWQELLASSREEFDAGTDFTVAVEEEFALLDPRRSS